MATGARTRPWIRVPHECSVSSHSNVKKRAKHLAAPAAILSILHSSVALATPPKISETWAFLGQRAGMLERLQDSAFFRGGIATFIFPSLFRHAQPFLVHICAVSDRGVPEELVCDQTRDGLRLLQFIAVVCKIHLVGNGCSIRAVHGG